MAGSATPVIPLYSINSTSVCILSNFAASNLSVIAVKQERRLGRQKFVFFAFQFAVFEFCFELFCPFCIFLCRQLSNEALAREALVQKYPVLDCLFFLFHQAPSHSLGKSRVRLFYKCGGEMKV